MSILTRLVRLCRADVHGVMDQLEDKGLLLKQYLREMEAGLAIKERQAAALADRLERLKRQTARYAGELDGLEKDLNLALARQRDDIARMLIRRRRAREDGLVRLREQIGRIAAEKDRLTETLANQRLEYEMLRIKAEAYGSRSGKPCCGEAAPPFARAADMSDEEVELELLRRKEAFAGEGAP